MFTVAHVSVIYCCKMIAPKLSNLKQQLFIISVSEGQESGCSLAGWFWLRVSHAVALRMSVSAILFEDLTESGEAASKVILTRLAS